jgi:hypothetical protein
VTLCEKLARSTRLPLNSASPHLGEWKPVSPVGPLLVVCSRRSVSLLYGTSSAPRRGFAFGFDRVPGSDPRPSRRRCLAGRSHAGEGVSASFGVEFPGAMSRPPGQLIVPLRSRPRRAQRTPDRGVVRTLRATREPRSRRLRPSRPRTRRSRYWPITSTPVTSTSCSMRIMCIVTFTTPC